jgi:phosphohistidine phosphatase
LPPNAVKSGPDDTKRPLTERGIQRFREAAAGLKGLEVRIDDIFTSPLVRAKQTADLLAAALQPRPSVKLLASLAPDIRGPRPWCSSTKSPNASALRSSVHEPDLGQLAAFLLGGKRPLPFRKGGICRIDVQGLSSTRAGSLIWFIPPRVLRKLAD